MKVIFVGLHNKAGLMPLDILSKSGKVISQVIKAIPDECIRTNLNDTDFYPRMKYQRDDEAIKWHHRINPDPDDIIVLLGAQVHKDFINRNNKTIKVPHPASHFYNGIKTTDYVKRVVDLINELKGGE